MNPRTELHPHSNRWLTTLCLLLTAIGCVDLTPPWEKNRTRDAGRETPWAVDAEGMGGASGGTSGLGGAGGTGGMFDTGGASGSDSVDAAAPPTDTVVPDSSTSIDAPSKPEGDVADAITLPWDGRLSDARTDGYDTEGGGTGGTRGDAAWDVTAKEVGETDAPVGSGGAETGGMETGGTGGTDVGVADAAAHCIGYVGPSPDGGLSGGLAAHYSFEQSSGTTLIDQSENQKDGTLGANGTDAGASGGFSFAAGKFGNALSFTVANKGYASLPTDLLNGACEVTIATWVNINSNPNWQRVWDFGRDTDAYMFLTTNNGGRSLKYAISIKGYQNESSVTTDGLPLGTWKHVALVLGSEGATLYVDGQQKANNPSVLLRPADLGNNLNNYIGRSQFSADPYLDGKVDEFRVYNRALTAEEIQSLFTGS